MSEDIEITIREIDPDDLPPEFDGLDPEFAYLLEPEGIEFDVPVTASFILDEEPVQDDGGLETELALLITSSDGELEFLDNLTQEADGDTIMTTASGELGHFSPLVAKKPGASGIINGVPDSLPVGGIFNAIATVVSSKEFTGLGRSFYEDESKPTVNPQFDTALISETPIPIIIDDENQTVSQVSLPYSCSPEGKGLYKATIEVQILAVAGLGLDSPLPLPLVFSKGVTCGVVTPTPTPTPQPSPSPGPSPSPSPSPTPQACMIMEGVYNGNGGCGVNMFRVTGFTSSGGNLVVNDFTGNPGPLTFNKTDNPNVFMSARTDIVIFGEPGHTCTITCGPANNQLTLECTMPGAVCQEVFTRQ